jgi:hypothetical protein
MSKAQQIAGVVVPILFVAGGAYYGWKSRHHGPGDSCSGDIGECTDKTTALFCEGGKYVAYVCRGSNGCREQLERVECDQSVAEPGDVCGEAGATCSVDGKRALDGKDHVLVEHRMCRGPRQCTIADGKVRCDTSLGEVGDGCTGEGTAACTVDKKAMLVCHEGKLELGRTCRGSTPCSSVDGKVGCDLWLAEAGDACSGDIGACAVDSKTYFECRDGKFQPIARCSVCGLEGENVTCSDPVPVP